MPKLAIYVPKDEMREIERFRARLNFSKIFLRAIQREIREQSRDLDADEDEIARAANHYRRLLAEDAAALVDSGHSLGVEQVLKCKLTPKQIRRTLPLAELETLQLDQVALIDETMAKTGLSIQDVAASLGCNDQTHPTWRASIASGFAKGVSDAWQRVCQQMQP